MAVMVERLRKEYLLEEQRPTGQAKMYYIKVICFSCKPVIAADVQLLLSILMQCTLYE